MGKRDARRAATRALPALPARISPAEARLPVARPLPRAIAIVFATEELVRLCDALEVVGKSGERSQELVRFRQKVHSALTSSLENVDA